MTFPFFQNTSTDLPIARNHFSSKGQDDLFQRDRFGRTFALWKGWVPSTSTANHPSHQIHHPQSKFLAGYGRCSNSTRSSDKNSLKNWKARLTCGEEGDFLGWWILAGAMSHPFTRREWGLRSYQPHDLRVALKLCLLRCFRNYHAVFRVFPPFVVSHPKWLFGSFMLMKWR